MDIKFTQAEIALLLNMVHYDEHQLIDSYNASEDGDYKVYLDDEIQFHNHLYKKLLAYYKEITR